MHVGKDGKRDHQFESVVSKNNIFQILFCIYIPVINAVMTESMARTSDETELNMLIATMGTLIRLKPGAH